MSIHVRSLNSLYFDFLVHFHIDTVASVKQSLAPGENLTNARALEIFQKIKFQADVLYYLTNAFVSIPLGIGFVVAAIFPPAIISYVAFQVFFGAVGIGLLTVGTLFDMNLDLSNIYASQSSELGSYITQIKQSHSEIKFTFGSPHCGTCYPDMR